jgi:iron(III) transport system permease protein
MLRNTALLLLGVGVGTLVLGTGLAWLVSAYRFPGRGIFDWLLLLPLAMPPYVMAFVFMATFDFPGPVQTTLRGWFGSSDWFPEIRSGWGAVIVLSLVLYPYVYLLARAAFHEQAAATFEAARMLGCSRLRAFFRVALPAARPSIAAGLTLALMETLTDIGAVRLLNFPTLTDGVFRVWHGMMDRQAATELAGLLLLFALAVILLERRLRGRARYDQVGGRDRGVTPVRLTGWRGWAAAGVCTLVLAAAFLLPVAQLAIWAITQVDYGAPGALDGLYWTLTRNTLILAAAASAVAVLLALVLASGVRTDGGRLTRSFARMATMGYAMPGAVVAMGVLVFLSSVDHAVDGLSETWLGVGTGLLLTGSIVGLVYAYVVRFMAVSYNSVEASLEKVTPNMDGAARTLGASPRRVLWRIHVPMVRAGMLVGATLVFVDVMRELPITLMLRPFGYDTLSVWVWQMAAESLWAEAALPSLTIVVAGLLPVVLLMRVARLSR